MTTESGIELILVMMQKEYMFLRMNPSTINFHNIKSLLLRKKCYTKPKKLVSSDKTGTRIQ